MTCLSDVYANRSCAVDSNFEEVENVELEDQAEEEKEWPDNDLDEDDAPFLVSVRTPNLLISFILTHQKYILFLHPAGIVLPPPEC